MGRAGRERGKRAKAEKRRMEMKNGMGRGEIRKGGRENRRFGSEEDMKYNEREGRKGVTEKRRVEKEQKSKWDERRG